MSTTPILDVSATSPPVNSTATKQSKQGNGGASVFGQLLTKEISKTQPQKTAARSTAKTGERTASADDSGWKSREVSPSTSAKSNTSEDTREVKHGDSQSSQPAAQTDKPEDAVLIAAATAVQAKAAAVDQPEEVVSTGGEMSEAVFEITLEMLTGEDLVEQPPPEIVQGSGVAVEQPPPQTTSPEPARLAEAQPETKLTSDQIAQQPITREEFQRLLEIKQANAQNAQTTAQGAEEVQTAVQSEQAAPESGSQNVLQTLSDQGEENSEQAAQPLNQPATQASTFLRSLQQYSQIKEVSFTQTPSPEVNTDTALQQEPEVPAPEVEQSASAAPIQSEAAPQVASAPKMAASTQPAAEPVMVEKPLPKQDQVQVEQPLPKQGEVQAEQPLPMQEEVEVQKPIHGEEIPEPEIEMNDKTEQGSSSSANVQNKPKISMQQGGQDLQTQEVPAEKQSVQAKPVQAKVEIAQDGVFKTNTGPSLQAQSESKSTSADSSQVSNEAVSANNQAPTATILNLKTNEISNKTSEVPTTVQRVVQQTFNQLEGMIQSGQKTLRVQLYPENLGHLELRVTSQNGSLQVVILADSSVTQQALQQNARDLQQTLQQSGVNLTGLTVGQRGDQEQTFPESYQAYQQKSKTNGRVSGGEDIEQIDTSTTHSWSYLNPYTSMEYRV